MKQRGRATGGTNHINSLLSVIFAEIQGEFRFVDQISTEEENSCPVDVPARSVAATKEKNESPRGSHVADAASISGRQFPITAGRLKTGKLAASSTFARIDQQNLRRKQNLGPLVVRINSDHETDSESKVPGDLKSIILVVTFRQPIQKELVQLVISHVGEPLAQRLLQEPFVSLAQFEGNFCTLRRRHRPQDFQIFAMILPVLHNCRSTTTRISHQVERYHLRGVMDDSFQRYINCWKGFS